jgi:NAD(P)H-flavin reductase
MSEPPSERAPAIAIPPEPTIKFRPQSVWATVKEVEDLTDTISFVRFKIDGGVFDFQPGQFVSVMAEKEGKSISRAYSIASPPEQKEYLELCIRKVPDGFMSNQLASLQPGAQVRMKGPLGRFILLEPVANDIAFIATGTGVAPFISMLGHIYRKGSDIDRARHFWLFLGVRYVKEMMYRGYLDRLASEHPNFHMVWVVSRPETPEWKGRVGHVQDFLRDEIKVASGKHAYICGLRHMLEETKPICEQMGFSMVRFEKWD